MKPSTSGAREPSSTGGIWCCCRAPGPSASTRASPRRARLSQVLGDDHDLALLVAFVHSERARDRSRARRRQSRSWRVSARRSCAPSRSRWGMRLFSEGARSLRRAWPPIGRPPSCSRSTSRRGWSRKRRPRKRASAAADGCRARRPQRRRPALGLRLHPGSRRRVDGTYSPCAQSRSAPTPRSAVNEIKDERRARDRPRGMARRATRRSRTGASACCLFNLGTPDGTDYWSMRRYLKEFLSDRRVIEVPRWKWWPILNLIILTVRPGPQGQGLRHDLEQRAQRGAAQDDHAQPGRAAAPAFADEPRIEVDWAMRYANPTTESRMRALQERGCDRILLVPLYPQYAAATTATACDQAFRTLMQMRWQPAVRVAPSYHDDPVYIDALATADAPRLGGARLRAGGDHRHLPRHAAGLSRGGRSLPLPVPEDLAPAARASRLAAGQVAHDLPVALRQRSLAAALYGRDGQAAGGRTASSASRSSRPGSRPIAWRRSRSSTRRTATISRRAAARSSPICRR